MSRARSMRSIAPPAIPRIIPTSSTSAAWVPEVEIGWMLLNESLKVNNSNTSPSISMVKNVFLSVYHWTVSQTIGNTCKRSIGVVLRKKVSHIRSLIHQGKSEICFEECYYIVTCQAHPVLVKKANQMCGSFLFRAAFLKAALIISQRFLWD